MLSRFSSFVGPLSVFYGINEIQIPPPNLILSLDSASASSYKINGGSIEFLGSGYLESSYNDFQFGIDDFTIELWFYRYDVPGDNMGIISNYYTPADKGVRLYLDPSNVLTALIYEDPYFGYIQYSTPISNETWYHAAIVRQGTNFSLYVNGVAQSVTVGVANINHPANSNLVIGKPFNNLDNQFFIGLMTNIKITNSAVYTSNFTPSTLQKETDANTSLLLLTVDEVSLSFDSSDSPPKEVTPHNLLWNPNTPITESYFYPVIWKDTSGNNHNFTFFTFSNVLKQFGNTLNVTDGNFLIGSSIGLLDKFTVDTWVNFKQLQGSAQIFTDEFDGGDINYLLGFNNNNIRGGFFKGGGTGFITSDEYTPILNKWYNFTLTYDKENVNLFVNGESFSTIESSLSPGNSGTFNYIGRKWDDNSTVDGYFSIINVWDGALTYSAINSNYNNLLDRFTFVFELNPTSWDASSSTIYDLKNNLTGTVSGVGQTIYYGGAFDFDQTQTINFGNPVCLNQSGDISVFVWVRFTDFTTSFNKLVNHYGSAPNDFVFSVKESIGDGTGPRYMNIYTQDNYGTPENPYAGIFDTTEIELGNWYNLGFTLQNGGDLIFYVNGITSSVYNNITRYITTSEFSIGSVSPNDGVSGNIGKIIMYNRILTQSEISEYYESSKQNYVDNFGSYDFDSNLSSYITTNESNYVIGTQSFTLEVWFNTRLTGFRGLVSLRNLSNQLGVSINLSPGSPTQLEFYVGGDVTSDLSEYTIETDTWYHAAISRDNNITRYFMNGVKMKEFSDNNNYQNSDFSIGKYYNDYLGYYYDGLMTDINLNVGTSLYNNSFIPSTQSISSTIGTQFLLKGNFIRFLYDDSGNANQFQTNGYITFTSSRPEYSETGGSLLFGEGVQRYFQIDAGSDWAVGTGDFCVEWFQYQTSLSPPSFSRLFSVGDYPNEAIAVSIENGNFLGWLNGGMSYYGALDLSGSLSNQWVHFAYTRQSGILSIYKDGVRLWNAAVYNNVNDISSPLKIGIGSNNVWNGYITNYRFVKGNYVYSGLTFSIPTSPLTPIAGTKLLLNAINSDTYNLDLSGLNKTVTNFNGVTWSSQSPFV